MDGSSDDTLFVCVSDEHHPHKRCATVRFYIAVMWPPARSLVVPASTERNSHRPARCAVVRPRLEDEFCAMHEG
jgi:hypothetical protein